MGSKFKIGKSDAGEMAERNSSLIPTTPLKKEDWSDKTVASWDDHSGFLERTNVTGVRPPPRFEASGLSPIVAAKMLGGSHVGSSGGSLGKVLGLLVLLPILGGAVYFGALGGDPAPALALVGLGDAQADGQANALASADLPAQPALKIQKNPNKNRKPAAAAAGAAAAATPSPPPSPTAAPSPSPAATATPSPAPSPNAATQLVPTELPKKQETPEGKLQRLASKLHPMIKFTEQPMGVQTKGAITRDSAVIALDANEITRLRSLAKRDVQLKSLIQNWRAQDTRDLARPPRAIATFKETARSDQDAIAARIELQKLRTLVMTAVVSGDPELAKRLRNTILVWSKTYVPLGDAASDAELEPVIEAYALLQSTLPIDQRRAVDTWLTSIADRQISELFEHPKTNDLYFAQHLKTMALIGFAIGNANLQNYVVTNLPAHVTSSIVADGSTTTYQSTHSIQKHAEHVQSLLRVSVLLNRAQLHAQDGLPKMGSPLAKAIDFAYPYLLGKMEHDEFKGAKQALEPEHKLNPQSALPFLDTALYFRTNLWPDLARLVNLPNAFAWDPQSLYFSAMARKTDDFEVRMLSPSNFRAPATNDSVHRASGKALSSASKRSKLK